MRKYPIVSVFAAFLALLVLAIGHAPLSASSKTPKSNAPLTVSAKKFGARPGDGKDDSKALRKAAAFCREHPGTTLTLEPGIYELRDTAAVSFGNAVMEGKYGGNPEPKIFTPYFPYVKGLDFSGSKSVTVEAEGATLLLEGWMEPISIIGCEDFTLRGLTIDYKRQPHSEGIISEITDEYFTVDFDSDCPMLRKNPMSRLCIWDSRYDVVHHKVYAFRKRELLDGNKWKIKAQMDTSMLGQRCGVTHSYHFRPAVFIGHSRNTRLEGVTIHSQPGMGILGFDSENITLSAVKVVPREGKAFSTNTDATHFSSCSGLIKIEDSTFQGQGDDAINVHGYYHDITALHPDGSFTAVLKAPTFTHAQETDVPRVGDTLEITSIATLEPIAKTVVTDVEWEPYSLDVRIKTADPLPEDYDKYYVFNSSKIPELEYRRNRVLGNFARGVLSKARTAVIEGNYFQGCSGTAIHVGAESDWKEGSFAAEALIKDNIIVNCGQSYGMQGGACGIAVIIGAPDTACSFIHGNVTITGNLIRSDLFSSECGIAVFNTDRLELRDNDVEGCRESVHLLSVREILTD